MHRLTVLAPRARIYLGGLALAVILGTAKPAHAQSGVFMPSTLSVTYRHEYVEGYADGAGGTLRSHAVDISGHVNLTQSNSNGIRDEVDQNPNNSVIFYVAPSDNGINRSNPLGWDWIKWSGYASENSMRFYRVHIPIKRYLKNFKTGRWYYSSTYYLDARYTWGG